jgi:hypothetical protein
VLTFGGFSFGVYYQKTRLTMENRSSRGFPIIIVEHSAQFVATADAARLEEARRRLDQCVLDALMIAPLAIRVSENRDGGPQMSFAQEYQTAQTFFLIERTKRSA